MSTLKTTNLQNADASSANIVLGQGSGGGATISGVTTTTTLQTADSIIHTGDTDTKIRFPSADTITAETGGSERLRIHSSGELTIGTATGTGNNLTVQDAGTSTTAGGNICARFQSNAAGRDATIQLSDNVSHSATISMLSSAFIFKQAGTETFRIKSDGNVIIGSGGSWSYPKALNVQGASGSIISLYNADTTSYAADTNSSIELKLLTGNSGNTSGSLEIRGLKENATNGDNARALSFYTGGNGGSNVERLRITSTGDVKWSAGSRSSNVNSICASNANSLDFNGSEYLYFRTANSERFRVKSDGTLLFGITSTNHGTTSGIILSNYTNGANNVTPGTIIASTTDIPLICNLSDSNDGIAAVWRKGGSSKGNVSISGNTTTYNTSSDYRLKENVVNITDGITRVKQLIPKRFNWISDETNTLQDGFLAHEVTPVVPEAVQGEKDAAPGDCGMGYQSMDHSKLVPLLTAALQEEITKREALETRVAALESA